MHAPDRSQRRHTRIRSPWRSRQPAAAANHGPGRAIDAVADRTDRGAGRPWISCDPPRQPRHRAVDQVHPRRRARTARGDDGADERQDASAALHASGHGRRRGRAVDRAGHRPGARGRRIDGRDDRATPRDPPSYPRAVAHLDHVDHRQPHAAPRQARSDGRADGTADHRRTHRRAGAGPAHLARDRQPRLSRARRPLADTDRTRLPPQLSPHRRSPPDGRDHGRRRSARTAQGGHRAHAGDPR